MPHKYAKGEIITPADQYGIPLAVVPRNGSRPNTHRRKDKHHHYHPSAFLLEKNLEENEERRRHALRHSRVQELPRWLHQSYHDHYAGPAMPEADADWFRVILLTYAGYVPKAGLCLNTMVLSRRSNYRRT